MLRAENREFWGNFAPSSVFPGVGKAFPPQELLENSLENWEFLGQFPKHSSSKIGIFFPKFFRIWPPWKCPNSGSVPALGLGSSRGFSSPKFGNFSPKFQGRAEFSLKFQNILEKLGIFSFSHCGEIPRKNSKELLSPQGLPKERKIRNVLPKKTQKLGKLPQFSTGVKIPIFQNSWDGSVPKIEIKIKKPNREIGRSWKGNPALD